MYALGFDQALVYNKHAYLSRSYGVATSCVDKVPSPDHAELKTGIMFKWMSMSLTMHAILVRVLQ